MARERFEEELVKMMMGGILSSEEDDEQSAGEQKIPCESCNRAAICMTYPVDETCCPCDRYMSVTNDAHESNPSEKEDGEDAIARFIESILANASEEETEDEEEEGVEENSFAEDIFTQLLAGAMRAEQEESEMQTGLLDGVQILKNTKKRTTTVLWGDGSVTIVKAAHDEKMDDYHAFTAAFAQRIIGSNTQVKKIVAKTTEMKKRDRKSKKQKKRV